MKRYLTNKTYTFSLQFISIDVPRTKLFEIDNITSKERISIEDNAFNKLYKLNKNIIEDPKQNGFKYVLIIKDKFKPSVCVTGELLDHFIIKFLSSYKNALQHNTPLTSDQKIDQIIISAVKHLKLHTLLDK